MTEAAAPCVRGSSLGLFDRARIIATPGFNRWSVVISVSSTN